MPVLARRLPVGTIFPFQTHPQERILASRAARTEKKRKPHSIAADHPFPVVGVGAWAGGLEPFMQFLRSMPADPGVAIIYLQHSDVSHISELPQVLGRVTTMPVRLAADVTALEPNVVYVAPPDGAVTCVNGVLRVAPRGDRPVLPIDSLFRSVATDQWSRAISVIPSG